MITTRLSCYLLFGALIAFTACEEPIDLPMTDFVEEYVVDGLITDQPGPHRVKITYSAAYTKFSEGFNFAVSGAVVSIIDSEGLVVNLYESNPGEYFTPYGFQSFPGGTYVLSIRTQHGDELLSFPETMPSVVGVADFYYEFLQDPGLDDKGHRIWIVVNDPADEQNYYRWRWEGVYMFTTYFDYFPGSTTCWRYEFDKDFIKLASDRFFNGNTYNQDICFIPYFSGAPYLVTVTQQSISKDAYNFFRQADQQINRTGGVFDSPPTRIRGNMYCVNDESKNVLGYFAVTSFVKQPVSIKRGGLGRINNLRQYPKNTNCWELPNSVEFIGWDPSTWPEGWEF